MKLPVTFVCHNKDQLERALSSISSHFEGSPSEPIGITVEDHQPAKSLDANAFYWGVLVPVIRDHAYRSVGVALTKEQVSDDLVAAFSPIVSRRNHAGRVISAPLSVSQMNKAVFATFCQKVEAYIVADLGLSIPANRRQAEYYQNRAN